MTEEEIEEPTSEEEAAEPARSVQELELDALRDYKDKYLRLLADSENARKRFDRERHEAMKHAVRDVLCEFLKPLDHFEAALKHAENSSSEVANWAVGFEMILAQFHEVLAEHGIAPFESKGTHFDPHIHEAVEMVETTAEPEGTILEEMVRGYKIGDHVLRTARVKVAQVPKKENQQEDK